MEYQAGYVKAIIHELKLKFGIDEFSHAHYKITNNKKEYFSETFPDNIKQKELFQHVFEKGVRESNSVKGFIEREIETSRKKKEIIGVKNRNFYDLLVEWIEFLKDKKTQLHQYSNPKNRKLNEDISLSHRELALLCYFKNIKMTEHNQNDIAKKYNVKNDSGKLFSGHYKKIIDDEKEIYQRKYAKKNLLKIKAYFTDEEVLKRINICIAKCNN